MGYWENKEALETGKKKRVEEPKVADVASEGNEDDDAPDMTLEEFEEEAQAKLEEDATYLSRKIKSTQKRLQTVTSDGFWFAVYFNNDTQKEEFLKKMGFDPYEKYIEGKEFVKRYHRSISTPDFDFGQERKPVKEYMARARVYKSEK